MSYSRWLCISMVLLIGTGCNSTEADNTNTGKASSDPVTESSEAPVESASDGRSWKEIMADVAGQVFLGSEKGAVFYAFDTLARPDETVKLTARLQTVKFLAGIEGAKLGYTLDDKLIGTAVTDKDGYANLEWKPDKVGDYDFSVSILEPGKDQPDDAISITPAPLVVAVRDKKAEFVVIDLDHTVVDSSFFKVLLGGGVPMADSVEVTRRIAKKYSLIYLTHRPDLMTYRSKNWLRENGYPLGPLLVSELKEALGSSGKYKTARLDEIKQDYAGVKIGIGDKLSDAQAYVDNGLVAYLIPYYKPKAKSMRQMADDLRSLRGDGRLQVVAGWRQVEKGIFDKKSYPASRFADDLDRQADQLKEEED